MIVKTKNQTFYFSPADQEIIGNHDGFGGGTHQFAAQEDGTFAATEETAKWWDGVLSNLRDAEEKKKEAIEKYGFVAVHNATAYIDCDLELLPQEIRRALEELGA